ncbi:hypothetical protein H6G25_09950 [Dolichospermum sp. FACHB-1091]|nr:hypothetical protein [Dolichospermum sp. FACHB-1091]
MQKQIVYALKQEQSLIDPNIIKAASQIYYIYCQVHPEIVGKATGVAISRVTHRGKVIFTQYPVLLPQECFVPLNQIESYMY